jgi:hypothetical protein
MQAATSPRDGTDRAPAYAQARGDLALRELALAEQTIDLFDEGGGKHLVFRISDGGLRKR